MEIASVMSAILRKWWLVLMILMLTLVATVVFTSMQPVTYTAKTTMITHLNQELVDTRGLVNAVDVLNRNTEINSTFSELAKSRKIKELAAAQLGVSAPARLTVNSRTISGTNMIEISVNAGSPQAAAVFADAIGQQTSLYANQLYPAYNLEILDAAVLPKTRTSPNLSLNYSLGAFLGLFIGISAAFLSVALLPARAPAPQLPQRKPGVNPGTARGVTDSSTLVRRYNQPSKD